jgi:hypothetical protein
MAYNDLQGSVTELWRTSIVATTSTMRVGCREATRRARAARRHAYYDYDSRGNWIVKRVEGRAASDQEFAVSSVERRTLVYYSGTM